MPQCRHDSPQLPTAWPIAVVFSGALELDEIDATFAEHLVADS